MIERLQGLFLDHWIKWLLGGLTGMVGWIFGRVRKWAKVNRSLQGASRALLRDRIIQAYNHYMEKGFCPIYAKENVADMHRQYQGLGGNGVIDGLIQRLMDLPTDPRHARPRQGEEI